MGRLLAGLAEHLPSQLDVLLSHPRYADEATALTRLAKAERRTAALAEMSDHEVQWLLQTLHQRWQAVGVPQLPPACAVTGPAAVWVSADPTVVMLTAAVVGIEPGWTAMWTMGATQHNGPDLQLSITAGEDDRTVHLSITGHTDAGRVLLDASHTVRSRLPSILVEEERRVLIVRDQHGQPGVGARLLVAGVEQQTDTLGRILLSDAVADEEIHFIG